MWDLTLFDSADAQCVNAVQLGGRWVSAKSVETARAAAKRASFLHFSSYEEDVALSRAAKENGCTLLVAISDFLGGDVETLSKRIAYARQFVKMANHFGADVKLVSLARDENGRREEKEMLAIGLLLGFTQKQMQTQLKESKPKEFGMKAAKMK